MEVHPGLFNPSAGGEGGGGGVTGSSSHNHNNNQGRLGLLSTDELATLCSYLPVVSVLALARSSKSLYAWVESLHFWREALEMLWPDLFYLLRNQPPTTAEACCSRYGAAAASSWRDCFLDKAETEVNWRRGRPVKIVQQSLLGDEDGRATTQAVQSLHLYRPQHIEGGREVLLTGMGGEASICLFQGEHVSTVARIRAHDQAKINTIRGTRDFICTTGMDHKVKLFDWVDGQERRVLQNHTSSVWGLDVDESNPSVLVSSGYCVASLTDLRMWQPPVTLRAHGTWIRSLQVDLARHLLVTGSCDATCKSWDLRMGRQVCKYQHPDHFEEVRSVQFQGDRLVTGCYDGMVREYELGTGRLKRVLADHHKLAVECAHFYGDRCVSVDWAGLLNFAALSGGDSGVERAMYGSGSPQANGMGRYRLSPYNMADGSLGYRSLGTREPVPTSLETTMSSAVCCMQAGDDRLVMGRKDGRLVQLIFRDCA